MHARPAPAFGRLTELPGVGEALAARLVKEFGDEATALAAVAAGDTARLAAVDGVGERRAADLVLAARGLDPDRFLRTPRARALYEDVVHRLQAFASTEHARTEASLLVPTSDPKEAELRLAAAVAAKALAARLPVDDLALHLRRVRVPRTPRPRYDAAVAVLVDTDDDRERLVKAGVDRHCQVTTAEDGADGQDLVVYAYSRGALDVSGMENVVSVPFTTDVQELVPDACLGWFRENRDVWTAVAAARALLGEESVCGEILAILDADVDPGSDWSRIERLVRDAARRMNEDMRAATGGLSLTGDEALEMMAGKTPRKIRDAQARVLREQQESIVRDAGDAFHVFTDGFPVEVDEEALAARRAAWLGRRLRRRFHERIDAARRLRALRRAAEDEVRALLEFDVELMIGRFALAYDLHPAAFGDGFHVEGALHLAIPRDRGDRVDYTIGGDHRVALLTGANSGGKTTLLETIAQVALLAHMGLPVPARRAVVEPVESLYFFTQKRSLDAGAFESFLRAFVPIVTSRTRKLVLADELEAMTELDAAARIVGTFLEMLRESGSCGVCVTHMAEEVSRHTTVRIDGIEARGLDDDMELIVDRTPRMGYRARSTPEFILRRLAARTEGEERAVFERVLASFRA